MTTIDEKSMNLFEKALQKAKNLPTHRNGELTPIYQDEEPGKEYRRGVVYNTSVERVFRAHPYCTRGIISDRDGHYYLTHDNNVMYHKKYARTDREVKEISFKIAGLKRESSKLPAGVLISDFVFSL